MINAGQHKAKKIGGDCGYTKGDKPQVAVLFQLIESGETITWYGHFTEKTEKHTLKSLVILGVASDFSNIADPSDNEVTLVIEDEADEQGVIRPKVRWVNGGDAVALSKRMTDGERMAFAQRMAGKMEIARKDLGTNSKPVSTDPFA
jgi:hypothetical protein